jgi:hypothetical protein
MPEPQSIGAALAHPTDAVSPFVSPEAPEPNA